MLTEQYLDLYVVGMLRRAEALLPELPPLDAPAAIYARISDDHEGQALGVRRQIEDARKLAKADGVAISDASVFSDDDVSASTLSRKPRPEFERLVAYVLSGQVKRVYAYSNSRLTRRPMELEVLIQLSQRYGLSIRTKVSGNDDLSTADGRMVARLKASVDAGEAERTGERVKRQKEQRLARGIPPGSRFRTFGYTKANVKAGIPGWDVVPEEAEIVREVFERIANGDSMNAVTNDLRSRGVKRVSGEPWSFQATSRMLRSHIYAGYVAYQGQRGAKSSVPALVDEALFDAANTAGVRRPGGRPNTRQTLLSGIAVCDVCKTPMIGSKNNGRPIYTCDRQRGGCGNVRIKRAWLDDLVHAHIWQVLAHDYRRRDRPATVDTKAQAAAFDELITKIRADVTAFRVSWEDALPMLEDLRRQRQALVSSKAVTESFHKVLVDYKAADVSRQSAEVRRHVSAIYIKPNPAPGNTRFDPTRFDVVLKSGEVVPGPEFVEEGFSRVVRWRKASPIEPMEGEEPASK